MSSSFYKFDQTLKQSIQDSFKKSYPHIIPSLEEIILDRPPSSEFGDLALGCFPWARKNKLNPAEMAKKLAEHFQHPKVEKSTAVGPYVNLKLSPKVFFEMVISAPLKEGELFGPPPVTNPEKIMLEYSSPNTNKPMHLGHVRNNTLGVALSNLLKACGHQVTTVNLVNDRGIHICKSMVAYQKWGKGSTPKSSGLKGDHFVGQYYVQFDQELKKEREIFFSKEKLPFPSVRISSLEWGELLVEKGVLGKGILDEFMDQESSHEKKIEVFFKKKDFFTKEFSKKIKKLKKEEEKKRKNILGKLEDKFNEGSSLLQEASKMLVLWEEENPEVRDLWKKMNQWVYEGFQKTYDRLGCSFDVWNYESQTYQLGKKTVRDHLDKGVFLQKEDSSIWAKLDGKRNGFSLQDKVVLRNDGTSVYITQDLGTAIQRFQDHQPDRLVYVVASEQNLHFATLFEILSRLGYSWADHCYHASYGMVTLPQGRGKLKSREGTAVDADSLLDEVKARSRKKILENRFSEDEDEIDKNAEMVALGTVKFLILNVNSAKDLQFDPEKDVHLTGDCGPAVQYSYPRIRSIYRKASSDLKKALKEEKMDYSLLTKEQEWELAMLIFQFPFVVARAGKTYSPSILANYLLELTKGYARFFDQCHVLKAKTRELQKVRLQLCLSVGITLKKGLEILGIPVPEKM